MTLFFFTIFNFSTYKIINILALTIKSSLKMDTKSRDIAQIFAISDTDIICQDNKVTKPNVEKHIEMKYAGKVDLPEQVTKSTTVEIIEQHIVPVVTEIHDREVIHVVETPIMRNIHEPPIIREVVYDDIQDGSFLEKQQKLKAFREDIVFQHANLKSAFPLSSDDFREAIKEGVNLRPARPLSKPELAQQLAKQKTMLKKSRYFSKDEFIGEFMAKKLTLKSVAGNKYSEEMSTLGAWKGSESGIILTTARSILKHTVETVQQKIEQIWHEAD
jgi:hypothetical protein